MPDHYVVTVTLISDEKPISELYHQTTEDPNVVRRVVAAVNVRQRRRGGKGKTEGDG